MGVRWGFVGACALLGLAKPGYWPLAGLALAVPRLRFGSRRSRATWLLLVAAAALLPSLAWLLYASWLDPQPLAPGADAAAQVSGMVRDPLRFGRLLVATSFSAFPLYAMGCVGWLGHHEVLLPTVVYVGLPLVWIATAVLDRGDPQALTRVARGLCAVLFAVTCAAVMTMAYVGWNPVGSPTLRGVQGRYLLPLLPLLAVVLPARGWGVGERAGGLYALAAGIALATAVVGVARQYYGLG